MRRTDRGWVAKHYPDHPSSHNLELEDDLSDCESLDSFFDEDFDDRQHSEKLGNLLTCNTLGVESKVSMIVCTKCILFLSSTKFYECIVLVCFCRGICVFEYGGIDSRFIVYMDCSVTLL